MYELVWYQWWTFIRSCVFQMSVYNYNYNELTTLQPLQPCTRVNGRVNLQMAIYVFILISNIIADWKALGSKLDADSTEYKVTFLQPGTSYEFQITAVGRNNQHTSEIVLVSTLPEHLGNDPNRNAFFGKYVNFQNHVRISKPTCMLHFTFVYFRRWNTCVITIFYIIFHCA